jgi:hypothetical protein
MPPVSRVRLVIASRIRPTHGWSVRRIISLAQGRVAGAWVDAVVFHDWTEVDPSSEWRRHAGLSDNSVVHRKLQRRSGQKPDETAWISSDSGLDTFRYEVRTLPCEHSRHDKHLIG